MLHLSFRNRVSIAHPNLTYHVGDVYGREALREGVCAVGEDLKDEAPEHPDVGLQGPRPLEEGLGVGPPQ